MLSTLLLALSSVQPISPDKLLTTYPYLQIDSDSTFAVLTETARPATVWVEYGTDTLKAERARDLQDGIVVAGTTYHRVSFPAPAGKCFYYRLCAKEMTRYEAYRKEFGPQVATPWTKIGRPATENDTFTAVVFNDLHRHGATFDRLLEQVKHIDYDFAVFNGDCIDDANDRESAVAFLRKLAVGVEAHRRPFIFLRGNHELRGAYAPRLSELFARPGNRPFGTFSWGDTHFVFLDCGEDKPDDHPVYYDLNDFKSFREEQVAFLSGFAASPSFFRAGKRILLHHMPLWGAYNSKPCQRLWSNQIQKMDFDLGLNGHTHSFAFHESSRRQNPFPLIVGGGYKPEDATVIILSREGNRLRIKVLSAEGETLLEKDF